MTNKEAIFKLIEYRRQLERDFEKLDAEPFDKAIEALEQEPCEDCISRQAVIDAMYNLCDTGENLQENPWRDNPHIDALVDAVEDLPPVTPQSKIGHWIRQTDDYHDYYECEHCGIAVGLDDIRNYCPNCGAKMEVEE